MTASPAAKSPAIRHVKDVPIEGKRVFLRVDFNVPIERGKDDARSVGDDSRIRASLETIRHCMGRGARLVLASHLGRPKGKHAPDYSLEPVAAHLAGMLDCDIALADEPVGDGARKVVADLRDGQIAMLENLRFHPGEEANAAGFLMYQEVDSLSRLLGEVDRPYLAILGGAKVSDKIEVLDALLERVDSIAIGGAMANTFLRARGHELGKSLIEEDKLAIARNFLRKAAEQKVQVRLPVDLLVAEGTKATAGRAVGLDAVAASEMALDIGPQSARGFAEEV